MTHWSVSIPSKLTPVIEPVFYLHHANLDRIYWKWQSQNLKARLLDISGPTTLLGPITGPNVTLSFPIEMGPLAPIVTVKNLMDIQGLKSGSGPLCYDYDDGNNGGHSHGYNDDENDD